MLILSSLSQAEPAIASPGNLTPRLQWSCLTSGSVRSGRPFEWRARLMVALTPNPVLSCWAKGGDDHVVVLIHFESFVIAFVGVRASTSCCDTFRGQVAKRRCSLSPDAIRHSFVMLLRPLSAGVSRRCIAMAAVLCYRFSPLWSSSQTQV
jgi:hypothetical protein